MPESLRRILFAAVAAAIVAASIQVAGQQTAAQPTFRTETNFVRVDAYPLRNGAPVTDLRAEDFEIFEDGVPQRIETFEHIVVRPAGPQDERREVSSEREAREEAANPRHRVFVLFLDAPNVTVEGSHGIREALIRLLDRVIGPDDLVGLMTPEMSASQLALGRKTEVIEKGLRDGWTWGRRADLRLDPLEQRYDLCFPPEPREGFRSRIAREMIARKRERATLEALQDLVRHLQGLRDERKAILTITEGWVLYREDSSLMAKRPRDPVPTADPVLVGPGGTLTTRDRRDPENVSRMECDADRLRLGSMDNDRFFRQILDEANRANASFYPIDPRGLPVFDTPIGPDAPPPPAVDMQNLRDRHETLRTLALNTDGIAVLNSNDLEAGLRRIAADLTSYYLLGYYSTNTKLDGRFRRLEVRVKRPGVEVRARRGYRAPTAEEVASARAAAAAPAPESVSAVQAAFASLARLRPGAPLTLNAISARAPDGTAVVWVAGELARERLRPGEIAAGRTVDVEVIVDDTLRTARLSLAPGDRAFLTPVTMPAGGEGEVTVNVRVTPRDRPAAPATGTVRLMPGSRGVLLYRRGVTTGNQLQPAASFEFSRTERLRLEVPAIPDARLTGVRLLDRNGQPLEIPVTIGTRTVAATSARWLTADVTLAPLGSGDYIVELTTATGNGEEKLLTAIRVTR